MIDLHIRFGRKSTHTRPLRHINALDHQIFLDAKVLWYSYLHTVSTFRKCFQYSFLKSKSEMYLFSISLIWVLLNLIVFQYEFSEIQKRLGTDVRTIVIWY